jgi:ERCC4-related helicase/dsRNA-specific ribonuclease
MDENQDPIDDGNSVIAGPKAEPFRLRSYQAEMVEESLKTNIIVAMDTGSGKTHIALARTAAELETCHPHQLVWFLAPTVTLCEQQYRVFQSHLPGFGVRVLSGNDNVDHWSEQIVWDSALKNIRIVLSTHQVLLDALTHAFVRLSRLALIIFDEAHHCTLNHPASRIMRDFYKPSALRGFSLPRILGLSASPVMRARPTGGDLRMIEENLNSVAKTPKTHRSELVRFVHKPELIKVTYPLSSTSHFPYLKIISALEQAHEDYDIMSDPYVCSLLQAKAQGDESAAGQLMKVCLSRETYCRKQLKLLSDKARTMLDELGASPTEWYLRQCITQYQKMSESPYHQQLVGWSSDEKRHLSRILHKLPKTGDFDSTAMSLDHISPKVEALIKVLVSEFQDDFTGLVFIEQRVWVAALAQILTSHPQTKSRFNIGTFVGTSTSTKRRTNLADLAELRNEQETLEDFRAGKKNLILATSVLEEGIDISSCHLVICFEPPKNLKSFIQRRGRARKKESKYIILLPESGSKLQSPEGWLQFEERMKEEYLNDLREVKSAEEREMIDEYGSLTYEVPGTGALLTLDNASKHLDHFCAIVGSGPYVDARPQYSFTRGDYGEITAQVTLPISVHADYRKATSSRGWGTERKARKDAAFQAYKALHMAGLVNDNLLPILDDEGNDVAEFRISDRAPSLIEVSPSLNPWIAVAETKVDNPGTYHQVLLTLASDREHTLNMVLLTPSALPAVPPIMLYWNETRRFTVNSRVLSAVTISDDDLKAMRGITRKLLASGLRKAILKDGDDFLSLFVPSDSEGQWNLETLKNWSRLTDGVQPAADLVEGNARADHEWGWIRFRGEDRRYMLKGIVYQSEDQPSPTAGMELEVRRAPKRRDFLHQIPESNTQNEAYTATELLQVEDCVVDRLPSSYSIFGMFIPSILHRYGTFLIAERLRSTTLKSIAMDPARLDLIVTALTSSATGEEQNYQRLEFLGDCVLKYITSVHLMASHLAWPESHLTSRKGRINSNGFLARATMRAGLDKFIITKRFTGQKWRPTYAADVLSAQPADEKVFRSSKVLADVVESLIGASYIEGGIPNALACMKALLPLEDWTPVNEGCEVLFGFAPPGDFTHLAEVESLVGYTFKKKTLLHEALTHASYNGPLANCSYERLEFLGDAVLDYILVERLFPQVPPLSHDTMHTIRTAMVNASFLAFRMFETTITEEGPADVIIDATTMEPRMRPTVVQKALWQFMRHNSPQIIQNQIASKERHERFREEILHELQHGTEYPWHLLSLSDAEKFDSDIVESVLGAIYVDSKGSIPACTTFLQNLGIMDCLERLLRDNVDCLHPKQRLGHLAVYEKVEYVDLGATKDAVYRIQVKVGGKEIGGVEEGAKRLNVETVAAWKACRIIRGFDDVEMGDEEEEVGDRGAEDGGVMVK